jgi:hypothetical protein
MKVARMMQAGAARPAMIGHRCENDAKEIHAT